MALGFVWEDIFPDSQLSIWEQPAVRLDADVCRALTDTSRCTLLSDLFWLELARALRSELFSLHTIFSTVRPAKVSLLLAEQIHFCQRILNIFYVWASKIKQMCQTALKRVLLEQISNDLLLLSRRPIITGQADMNKEAWLLVTCWRF